MSTSRSGCLRASFAWATRSALPLPCTVIAHPCMHEPGDVDRGRCRRGWAAPAHGCALLAASAAGELFVHQDPSLAEVDLAEVVVLVVTATGERIAEGKGAAAIGHPPGEDPAVVIPAG